MSALLIADADKMNADDFLDMDKDEPIGAPHTAVVSEIVESVLDEAELITAPRSSDSVASAIAAVIVISDDDDDDDYDDDAPFVPAMTSKEILLACTTFQKVAGLSHLPWVSDEVRAVASSAAHNAARDYTKSLQQASLTSYFKNV